MIDLSFLKTWGKHFSSKAIIFSWFRRYKLILFFCFCIVLGFGGWSWYYSLYQYNWSEDQKKSFLDSYAKETMFKENKFQEVVDRLKALAQSHQEKPTLKRDIFSGENLH